MWCEGRRKLTGQLGNNVYGLTSLLISFSIFLNSLSGNTGIKIINGAYFFFVQIFDKMQVSFII